MTLYEIEMHEKKFYLDGIILAKRWLFEAELQGHPHIAIAYKRILDDAISIYKNKFQDEKSRKYV